MRALTVVTSTHGERVFRVVALTPVLDFVGTYSSVQIYDRPSDKFLAVLAVGGRITVGFGRTVRAAVVDAVRCLRGWNLATPATINNVVTELQAEAETLDQTINPDGKIVE